MKRTSLKILTWGTAAAALGSSLLLAAGESALPDLKRVADAALATFSDAPFPSADEPLPRPFPPSDKTAPRTSAP